jgi:pimeloyl-ACP methyl ester carboxylesterase
VVGPRFAVRHSVHALDRRGRGASGDGDPYSIEREYEDVAAVSDALAEAHGGPVDVIGHSFGGRTSLGAALRTPSIRRVVAYESAPASVVTDPAARRAALDQLRRDRARGDLQGLLVRFLRDVVGMTREELERYQADPVWPLRVAAAGTIPRELEAEGAAAAGPDTVGAVRIPVLQVVGGASPPRFREAAQRLHERLADPRMIVIDGARHGAHHTHPDAFVAAVEAFLEGPISA